MTLTANFQHIIAYMFVQVQHYTGIILGANFIPVGYFSMFFSQKIFAILHFDGLKFFHPKNRQIII